MKFGHSGRAASAGLRGPAEAADDLNPTLPLSRREASINDVLDRRFHRPAGPRPADHPGLAELGMQRVTVFAQQGKDQAQTQSEAAGPGLSSGPVSRGLFCLGWGAQGVRPVGGCCRVLPDPGRVVVPPGPPGARGPVPRPVWKASSQPAFPSWSPSPDCSCSRVALAVFRRWCHFGDSGADRR
jgi:hypothetical protein